MTNTKYAFQVGNQIKFIDQSEIMYCLSDANYTDIVISCGKKVVTSKSLTNLEKIFDSDLFIRIHNSMLINISFIESFSHRNLNTIIMTDGKILQVSRRKKKIFLLKFKKL